MTRWFTRPAAWAILAVCGLSGTAGAQQIGNPYRPQVNPFPTVSPAVNLRGPNPVTGYFGIVRPQQDTNRALQNLQADFTTQQQQINPLLDPQVQNQGMAAGSSTGHPVTFFNTRQYFSGPNNRFSLGTGAGGGAGYFNQGNGRAPGLPIAPGLNIHR